MTYRKLLLIALCLSALRPAGYAQGIIPIGSDFTLVATNAPDDFTADTTFGLTTLVDSGSATLTMEQIPTGANSEWDIWTLTTTSGAPIAGDTNANWEITMDYDLSVSATFDAVFSQWTLNGTAITPTGDIGSISGTTADVPILGGGGFTTSGFSVALAAGPQNDWNEIYIDPYNQVMNGGIDSDANAFSWGLHFTTAVPEPATPGMIAAGLAGAGFLRYRWRRPFG